MRYKRGRELAGLSLPQASRLLGIERTRLADIEATRVVPEHQEVLTMADCYGTSEAWLDGAEPELPAETVDLLRDDRLMFSERDALAEVIGSMGRK